MSLRGTTSLKTIRRFGNLLGHRNNSRTNDLSPSETSAEGSWLVPVVAFFLCLPGQLSAQPQDELTPEQEASAPLTLVAAPVRSAEQPRPAEMSSYALRGLMLDIDRAGDRYFAVGERGNIVTSEDGVEWSQVEVPVRATLTGISFADAQHGWAVGHDATIVHTDDGGRSWRVQAFNPELERPIHDVMFLDRSNGYAFGSFGLFWQTRDGGKSWTEVQAPAVLEDGFHLNGMTQLNNGQLLIVGEFGLIGLSSPNGSSWELVESPYEGSFFGAVPRGEKGALVFGMRGNVYVSDDVSQGQWRKIDLATVSSIFGALAMKDGVIVLVGADASVFTVTPADEVERMTTNAAVLNTDTFNSAVSAPDGLMIVGEAGIQHYPMQSASGSAESGKPVALKYKVGF